MIRAFLHAVGPDQAGPLRASLALTTLVSAVQGVLFALLVPVLTALLSPDPQAARPWLGVLLGAAAGYAVLRATSLFVNFRVGGAVSRGLHHRIGDQLVRLPLGWFTRARVGELNRITTDAVSRATNLPVHLYPPLADAVVTPVVAVAALALWDWRLGLAAAACLPLLWVVFRRAGDAAGRYDGARDAAADEAADRVLEFAQAQPVLRAFGRAEQGTARLDAALAAEHGAFRTLLARAVPALLGYSFAVRFTFAVLLAGTVYLAAGGDLAAPRAVALLVLVARFTHPLAAAGEQSAALRMAVNQLQRINAVLDARPLPEPATPVPPRGADVEFDGVVFSYSPEGPRVLDGVDLRAEPGTLTALVGPSGSGKTTAARLLARFHDVDAGSVRVGGVDVREIGSDELSRHVAVVFQDVYLFDASIAENVRVADPDATRADLDRVAALAGLDTVVAELPEGWDTRVGEGGAALSGGQRQRVSIARALLKDAPIVVLDEASAALDAENEAVVTAAAVALAAEGRTVLVIAHRPATVAAADQVVFLDGGKVAEAGPPGELLARGGRHADFVRTRERARGWRLTSAAP
ncbi:ABC transporter ATP-binding protein/permease [Streptomonospora sp. S1-112]|uniref:ABC transporter ATP-binding protein/permease n=1 Tax=Streptomonospora mangrovi TaxID=2883123 RepID=A0A9X3SEX0_9ACTN|nr:ABC transporter ATP-binding protein [Streptomonospora mangrovi]MDA0566293.1 ABC transporter ATP-binding protein/permease [Streptomonospora mangrovi]